MKMNITDAYKKATKKPLIADDGMLYSESAPIKRVADTTPADGDEISDEEWHANAALLAHAFNVLPEVVAALEDAREFILRFDESDPEKLAASKRISDMLDKAASVEIPE